jgi:N-acetylglutamate synthase-like GNAT family acetyltransferase
MIPCCDKLALVAQIFETHRDKFTISTDPAHLDINAIVDMISRAYWAKGRPQERTEQAIANSLVFGVYEGKRQIGVARVVTDYSIVAYLCDVFIHEDYRGRGLGKWLVESVLSHPDVKNVRRWFLVTSDAHDLYRKYDFNGISQPEIWMERIQPFAGE